MRGHKKKYKKPPNSSDSITSKTIRPENTDFRVVHGAYIFVFPLYDMSDAAAAAAVGTTPVETPGFDKCSNLKNHHITNSFMMCHL